MNKSVMMMKLRRYDGDVGLRMLEMKRLQKNLTVNISSNVALVFIFIFYFDTVSCECM